MGGRGLEPLTSLFPHVMVCHHVEIGLGMEPEPDTRLVMKSVLREHGIDKGGAKE